MGIKPITIPCIVMASVAFYVGAYHSFMYLRRRKVLEHLPFALLCFSVGIYDLFCIGLYNAASLNAGLHWQGGQIRTVAAISFFVVWFANIHCEGRSRRVAKLFMAWFVLLLAVSLVAPGSLTLSSDRPSIKHIAPLPFLAVTYHEGSIGLLYQVLIASAVVAYSYVALLFFRYYRKTRTAVALAMLVCQMFYFLAVMNDSLVALGMFPFYYASEYAFFLVILSMAYALLDSFTWS